MNDPTFLIPNVGAYVKGPTTSARRLCRWRELVDAYAALDLDTDREAYLTHFAFGPEMEAHYRAHGGSVAGFNGPTWAKWIVLDIDRPDLATALADARRLLAYLLERYPLLDGSISVFFSGSKGFHVYLELVHEPPPAVGFNRVCRTLAEGLAAAAEVTIDGSIYDAVHLIRLPNTRHPKTGLYKRRIDADDLFQMDVAAVLDRAKHPAGDGILTMGDRFPEMERDWHEAERRTDRKAAERAACQPAAEGDRRAPRFFLDFLRFAPVEDGDAMERHKTLFRSAAWLAEEAAPPPLIHALLTEPACDVGLPPSEVRRTIDCGIAHARRSAQKCEGGTA